MFKVRAPCFAQTDPKMTCNVPNKKWNLMDAKANPKMSHYFDTKQVKCLAHLNVVLQYLVIWWDWEEV